MITVTEISRLGNQLFQLAGLIGVAKLKGYDCFIDKNSFLDVRELFNPLNMQTLQLEDLTQKSDFNGLFEMDITPFSESLDIHPSDPIPDNTILKSYFQSESFFINAREEILKLFKIQKKYLKSAEDIIKRNNIGACMHIRGGDYVGLRHSFRPETYIQTYKRLCSECPNENVAIVTDDPEMCQEIFNGRGVHIENNSQFLDFSILHLASKCMVSNSTFAFWARWLSDRPTYVIEKFKDFYGCSLNWEPVSIDIDYSRSSYIKLPLGPLQSRESP